MDRAVISNIKDWRKVRTKTITTRSGLTVILRRDVSTEALIAQGTVPLPLLEQVQQMGDLSSRPASDMASMLNDLLPAIDAVCVALAHSPRLLSVEEYRSLIAEGAAALGVSETILLDWLTDDGSEAHLAGLPVELHQRLMESISVGELSMEDRFEIFNAALGGAAPRATFPPTA